VEDVFLEVVHQDVLSLLPSIDWRNVMEEEEVVNVLNKELRNKSQGHWRILGKMKVFVEVFLPHTTQVDEPTS